MSTRASYITAWLVLSLVILPWGRSPNSRLRKRPRTTVPPEACPARPPGGSRPLRVPAAYRASRSGTGIPVAPVGPSLPALRESGPATAWHPRPGPEPVPGAVQPMPRWRFPRFPLADVCDAERRIHRQRLSSQGRPDLGVSNNDCSRCGAGLESRSRESELRLRSKVFIPSDRSGTATT